MTLSLNSLLVTVFDGLNNFVSQKTLSIRDLFLSVSFLYFFEFLKMFIQFLSIFFRPILVLSSEDDVQNFFRLAPSLEEGTP